jgi:hypothetical protein
MVRRSSSEAGVEQQVHGRPERFVPALDLAVFCTSDSILPGKDGYIKIARSGYWHRPLHGPQSVQRSVKGESMTIRTRFCVVMALLSLLALMPSSGRSQDQSQNSSPMDGIQSQPPVRDGIVYVCACLKTKSCFCMTEAKAEGPCACGTKGGPPMKAVFSDSAWAKANREALTK